MNKRVVGTLVLIIVIAALFYFSQDNSRLEKSSTAISSKRLHLKKGLEHFKSRKTSSPFSPDSLSTTSIKEPSTPEDSKGGLCWKKIISELEDQAFRTSNNLFLKDLVGEWYFAEDSKTSAESAPFVEGKFMLALARAGLLDGREILTDEEEALKLLSEVSESDPKNSAPILYAAIIESRRGNSERAEELFAQAQKSEFFDSYITAISKSIFSRVRTPSDLLQAYGIWSTLPIPDYTALKGFLKERDAKTFALQLIKSGLDDESLISEIEWFPLDYAVGKSLLDALNPKNTLPTYRDILKRKNEQNLVSVDKLYFELKSMCDISSLNPMVDLLQRRLSHHR